MHGKMLAVGPLAWKKIKGDNRPLSMGNLRTCTVVMLFTILAALAPAQPKETKKSHMSRSVYRAFNSTQHTMATTKKQKQLLFWEPHLWLMLYGATSFLVHPISVKLNPQ